MSDHYVDEETGRMHKIEPYDSTSEVFNEGHILEGLDRCHTIALLLHELLNGHPAVIEAGAENHRSRAYDEVMAMYQKIGSLNYS